MPTARPTRPSKRRFEFEPFDLIVPAALLMAAFEIVVGGGRVSVLTFLGGTLLAPAFKRYDERDKK